MMASDEVNWPGLFEQFRRRFTGIEPNLDVSNVSHMQVDFQSFVMFHLASKTLHKLRRRDYD